MFLNYLKDENKENFLKECVHAALINGVFADEEKNIFAAYCKEMNLDFHLPDTQEEFSVLINSVSQNTTLSEKKIFILEILALIKSDGTFDEKEVTFMQTLIDGLNINMSDYDNISMLLDKYILVGKELFTMINA